MSCAVEHIKFELLGGRRHWLLRSTLDLLAGCVLVYFVFMWPVPPTVFHVLTGSFGSLLFLSYSPAETSLWGPLAIGANTYC